MTVTNPKTTHAIRIRNELRDAGLSHLATLRFTSRYIPKIIHENEHIMAAIFGHHKVGTGLLDFTEGVLIATDRRVIYMDSRPGFTTIDEISYEIISGVNQTKMEPISSVTLFTKIGNYTISFAKHASVQRFADYIETYRLDKEQRPNQTVQLPAQTHGRTLAFLEKHDTAVLSTIDRAGNVTGAAIYYTMINGTIYIVTKDSTKKARNIFAHPHVALTVLELDPPQEAQLQADAEVETDITIKGEVFERIAKLHFYASGNAPPPATKIQNGAFVVIRLTPTSYSFSDYS